MRENFSLQSLGPIFFGPDYVEELPTIIGSQENRLATKIALISDEGVAATGIVDRICNILQAAGLKVSTLTNIKSDPKADEIDAIAGHIRELSPGWVIGVGGGSVLDVTKLAAVIAAGKKSAESYALCAHPLPKSTVKKVLIPTTAGTGSEATRVAIFSNSNGHKVWAWDEALRADLVVLDPTLTLKLPPHLTAATGLDALVHAIEACTSKRRNSLTDCFAHHAIRLASKHLLQTMKDPQNLEARGKMLLAATLGGLAIEQSGTGMAHAIGHALADLAPVHHGRAVAIGLDAVLAWNAKAAPESHADVADSLGVERRAELAGPRFAELLEKTQIDSSLTGLNLNAEDLVQRILAEENLPMVENNARTVSREDVLILARRTLGQD